MASGSGWNLWVWLAEGGCGWNLWVWLVGVVVRRYIDFLILLIPTPLVSVLFCSSIPSIHKRMLHILRWTSAVCLQGAGCRSRSRRSAIYTDALRVAYIRARPASFKGRRS